jgi:hypothetical protein
LGGGGGWRVRGDGQWGRGVRGNRLERINEYWVKSWKLKRCRNIDE